MSSEINDAPEEVLGKSSKRGCVRFGIVGLLFCMFAIQFGMRSGFALAIIAMTRKGTSSNPDVPYYNWDNSSIILSAFYWAYPILQFVTGPVVHRFGNKNLLLASVIITSLAHILIPPAAAYLGSEGVIALRVLQGLFQGSLIPCLNGILGRWLPPSELSVLYSVAYSGLHFGIIVTKVVTGFLSASSWGWPSSFYILGASGLLWSICWKVLSTDTPANHPWIGKEERKYIQQALNQEEDHMLEKKPPTPWREIFKSLPFWAIVTAAVGSSWITTFLSTQLPSYLSYAVGLNIVNTGLVSAASTACTIISILTFGSIASYTLKKGWLSVVNSRRIFQALCQYTRISLLLSLSFIEDPGTVIGLYILCSLVAGAASSGHLVNSVDLSPRYASGLCGIANGTGQIIAILAPLLVQYMVTDKSSHAQWRNTFYLASAVGGAAATFYIIFCSGEKQWWDDGGRRKKKDDNRKDEDKDGETGEEMKPLT